MKKNQKKQFEFSVVMAIYNVEKYLNEAIDSVINQTIGFEDNIEIILVNDGSPDNSEKICKEYVKKYPNNIKYIKKRNGGVSSARNRGLKEATGKIINFLDSDDYFSENAFKKVLDFYKKNKKTDVVAINLINFEKSSGSWVNGEFFKKTRTIDMTKEYNFMQCQVGASFIKEEAAHRYEFDENIKIHEDSHYLYRIFRDNPQCGVISDATYWHRIRSNGTSATQTIKHKENVFNMTGYLLKDLLDFYRKKYSEIPSYFQTFIILEFNYYVLEKIPSLELTKEEKEKLTDEVKNVIDSLDVSNIDNHPYVSETIKARYKLLKGNIQLLFKKGFIEKPYKYFPITKKISFQGKRTASYLKRVARSAKRRLCIKK